ncbi:MAG: hypothetical protein M1839_008965 [Geoglossum umbratile]|nr:MAG: hypothetical protein M1839_008965 [Geoglossum umbratile]
MAVSRARAFSLSYLVSVLLGTFLLWRLPVVVALGPPTPTGLPPIANFTLPTSDFFTSTQDITVKGFKLSLPDFLPAVLGTRTFTDLNTVSLELSLPQTLKQFNIPPDRIPGLVETGIPIINAGLLSLFSHPSTPPSRIKRGGSIGEWIEDLVDAFISSDEVCAVAVAIALPGYIISAGLWASDNPDEGVPTSLDQDFFLFPIHQSLSHDVGVKVNWDAVNALGFSSDPGTGATYNRNIYLLMTNQPDGLDPGFAASTRKLLHEMTHVRQYRDLGFNLVTFGTQYLWGWCKAVWSYADNPMEQEAFANEFSMEHLLKGTSFTFDGFIGHQFFLAWKLKDLSSTLGLPTARVHTVTVSTSPEFAELPFQKGLMEISESPTDSTKLCLRTFTSDEVATRSLATNCKIKPPCPGTRRHRRSPKPPDGPPDKPECDPDEVSGNNAACNAAKTKWPGILSGKTFDCTLRRPMLLPGCPPTCKVVTPIPLTSHSCRFDPPPENCGLDPESVRVPNEQCRAEILKCNSAPI